MILTPLNKQKAGQLPGLLLVERALLRFSRCDRLKGRHRASYKGTVEDFDGDLTIAKIFQEGALDKHTAADGYGSKHGPRFTLFDLFKYSMGQNQTRKSQIRISYRFLRPLFFTKVSQRPLPLW